MCLSSVCRRWGFPVFSVWQAAVIRPETSGSPCITAAACGTSTPPPTVTPTTPTSPTPRRQRASLSESDLHLAKLRSSLLYFESCWVPTVPWNLLVCSVCSAVVGWSTCRATTWTWCRSPGWWWPPLPSGQSARIKGGSGGGGRGVWRGLCGGQRGWSLSLYALKTRSAPSNRSVCVDTA